MLGAPWKSTRSDDRHHPRSHHDVPGLRRGGRRDGDDRGRGRRDTRMASRADRCSRRHWRAGGVDRGAWCGANPDPHRPAVDHVRHLLGARGHRDRVARRRWRHRRVAAPLSIDRLGQHRAGAAPNPRARAGAPLMHRIVSWPVAFVRFWYHFIIGDDWTVAAAVIVALLVTALLNARGVVAWWLVPLVVIVLVTVRQYRAR